MEPIYKLKSGHPKHQKNIALFAGNGHYWKNHQKLMKSGENGNENLSAFVPKTIEDLEKIMKEEGILQKLKVGK